MNKVTDIPLNERDDLSTKTALCWDNGLFIDFCATLGKTFKKVYFFMPWVNAFPKSNQYIVGEGIDGIERIHDFFDYVDKADIIIFPDVYMGDLQVYLEKQGKLVWGCRYGEDLELLRDEMKEHMADLGLYVTPWKKVIGLDALRSYLKEHDNVFVKQNTVRGDFESFHSLNYKLIEPVLDELEHSLGAVKLIKEFIVEDAYDNAVETGTDLYTVDGKYPSKIITGCEIKDCGYVSRFLDYDKIDKRLTDFNDAISGTMEQCGYRGFFSTEIRISKDKKPYMLDFTARLGSPPNELYQNVFTNLADIVWYGAKGYVIDPVVEYEYAVEAMIHSSWADKNWQAIFFPEKYRQNIKLRNACKIKGEYYVVPQHVGLPEIGAVVGLGHTLQEAIDMAKKIADTIEGHYIEIKLDSFDRAQEEFDKLEEMGVKIL